MLRPPALISLLLMGRPGHATAVVPPPSEGSRGACLGEFSFCNSTGSCTLSDCTSCAHGEYRCPLPDLSHDPPWATCVHGAAGYLSCPNMTGTHLDWTLSEAERLDYLVAHTTLAEQAAQLTAGAPALERMGIPSYNWLDDDVHGTATGDGTNFPNGVTLGMSWDRELLHRVGRAIGLEARGGHNGFVHSGNRGPGMYTNNGVGISLYAPNMNLVRDPRWGRAQEVYSECPQLTSELTVGFVTGAQGASPTDGAALDEPQLLTVACCKHLAAYDLENYGVGIPPNNGVVDRVHFNANVTSRNMWETYLPPFEACLRHGRAGSVMASFNSINGVPSSANGPLINGVLRKQWGADFFAVSDYDGWANLVDPQGFSSNFTAAAAT